MNVRSSLPRGNTRSTSIRLSDRSRAVLSSLAPLLLLYMLYTLIRWTVVERGEATGDRNAARVIDFERRFNLDWELTIQSHLLPHTNLVWLANHYYVYAFFPVLVVSAILGALRAPVTFRFWRNVFALSLGIALVGFSLFPLTPPRLLPANLGFVDTLMIHGPRYYGDESGASLFNAYGSIPSMVNEYAAMPSMHVGWSVIAAVLLIATFPRKKWIAVAAFVHVTLMQFVVVATANHYVIDGAVGMLVVLASYLCVKRFAFLRTPQLKSDPLRSTPAPGD